MKIGSKVRLFLGLATAAAVALLVLGWLVASSDGSKVAAANQENAGGATIEMLNYALNFRSASNLAVFGGNSVSDNGSEIRGVVGSTGDVVGISANAMSAGDGAANRRDLMDAFSAVDQLPCTQVSGDLGGQTFGPGVYCVGSATLAGRMTVDAGGDANARFVFRVDGSFTAEDGSSIVREGGAVATNVYVFASRSASIGANATIGSNVISREDVTVGNDSTVSGKVIGVSGDVTTNANIVAAGTGYVEVCKELALNEQTIPVGTRFTFSIPAAVSTSQQSVQVPAGPNGSPNCSPPIQVAAGTVSVTETAPTVNVAVVKIVATPSTRLLTSSSLASRRADLNIPTGDVNDQTVVTFTNQTTRTGTVEICKYAAMAVTGRMSPDLPADPDVTGFFSFTVQGSAGIFSIPVGFCSGPITVILPQTSGTQPFTTNVTELARTNYICENATTFPTGALNGFFPDLGSNDDGTTFTNTNGCYANVALNVAGGAANQTTVRFFNRSLPGRIKICKITADLVNLPIGTTFRFLLWGLQGPLPGTIVAAVPVDVPAGPASQGGFCTFAPGTWVVGANVFIQEFGISPNNTTVLPLDQCPGCAGTTQFDLQVSRIQASTGFPQVPITIPGLSTFTTGINPDIFNANAVIQARNTTAEVEFTDFIYRPAVLKLCKNAAGNIPAGTRFTFSIAPADPLTTWPYPSAPITVAAGSCTFVNGPFPADNAFPGVGLFNFGTSIVVTEAAVPNSAVLMIASSTLTAVGGAPNFNGTLTVDLNNRRGTLTLNNVLGVPVPPATPANYYFNELTFLNGPASAPPPVVKARFDFDGDHRSDIAVFRPTDGTWYYSPSSAGGARGVQFGANGDIPMAADYDGDGVADPAVFRPSTGTWYMLRSSAGFGAMQFGMSSDIPAAADFDGDGRADVAVFRPSNGTWYIMGSTNGFSGVQFGMNGDVPVAADFDGDGRADVAVFRPSSGTWYMLRSTAGFTGVQFGMNGDIPVGADYDGDGRADAAVFRPSTGTWYMLGSSAGFSGVHFGMASDTPVPADYDGDGRTDVGVYRGSDRTWYILNSSQSGNAVGGLSAMQFGANGDQLMRY